MATKGIGKGVRSARGELVDFDLLRIKENLGAAPKASTVKAREDFIDSKFKRRLRRMSEAAVAQPPVDLPVVESVTPVEASTEQAEPAVVPQKKRIIAPSEE